MKEYFSHDYNARNDPKLQNVMMELGLAGIGLYWCVVEQLYEQGGIISLSSIKAIAFGLHVEAAILERLINGFELFESDDEYFWSASVAKRVQRRKEISEMRSEAGRAGAAKKWQDHNKCEANTKDNIANAIEKNGKKWQIKENKSKEKEIKEKESKEKHIIDNGVNDEIINSEKTEPDGSVRQESDPDFFTSKVDSIDWGKLRKFWNETVRGKLSSITVITDGRKAAVRARMNAHGRQAVYDVIAKTARSDFLTGDNDRNWMADFDWVFKQRNFVRILEGKYDNSNRMNNENSGTSKYGNRRGYTDFTSTSADDYKGGF